MLGSLGLYALGVTLSMFGDFHTPDVRKLLVRQAPKTTVVMQIQIRSDKYPDDAAARFVHKFETGLNACRFAGCYGCLELNVPDDLSVAHHHVIAAGVEL